MDYKDYVTSYKWQAQYKMYAELKVQIHFILVVEPFEFRNLYISVTGINTKK